MTAAVAAAVVPNVAPAGSDVAAACRSGCSSGGYQFPSDANHHPSPFPIVATFASTFHCKGCPYPAGHRRVLRLRHRRRSSRHCVIDQFEPDLDGSGVTGDRRIHRKVISRHHFGSRAFT